ncbi:2-hydroxyacyl-CoA dehydratase family protein [Desulfovibrio sp. OttesenSCG-928-O18]|nr:2-hydroxyacyl-CoA dehydratase family protein [Desulfovibrio sp. OttesenSCG-928-O18]
MADLQILLNDLGEAASHPGKMLQKHLAAGKKVVGCFPLYSPEELVFAAGMVPMGLWGGQVNPAHAGKYNPIFTCSVMRSCLEYGMTGVYKGVSAVLMPMLCDTFRGMSAGWRFGVKDIELVAFIHPQNRTDSGALEFMAEEYKTVRERLEKIAGAKITDDAVTKAIEVYNEHSAVMMEFAKVANDHLDVITPVVRHHVYKSAHFMPKDEHTKAVKAVIDELKKLPKFEWKGKKVILSGLMGEPDTLLSIFSENNIAVTGDDLAQESRQYRTPIPAGKDPMERLAKQWLDRKACSTVHEVDTSRATMLVDMAKETGASGIALCLMRFCDVEEYEYPLIQAASDKAGLHCLCLEIDQSTMDNEQSRTKIQSFAEMR